MDTYLGSADVARDIHQSASRWAIDFGVMPLEAARQYPHALAIVRERVKSVRDAKPDAYVGNWWQFNRPRRELRQALEGLDRYIVMGRHGKRLLFVWTDAWTLASDATKVFAFDDDYSMGVLFSRFHDAWAKARSSTIKGDPRYTNTSCFETFPWPCPTIEEERERIAEASRRVIARRQQICVANSLGLTTLYNLLDEGAYTDLKTLIGELDEAVATAYGWPNAVAQNSDEIVQRLLILNQKIAADTREYSPFDAIPELTHFPLPRDRAQQQGTPTPQPRPAGPADLAP